MKFSRGEKEEEEKTSLTIHFSTADTCRTKRKSIGWLFQRLDKKNIFSHRRGTACTGMCNAYDTNFFYIYIYIFIYWNIILLLRSHDNYKKKKLRKKY